ncbi:MAG: molybdenum cofactor guanylyltransferase [Gammaproteobacteria bacterium]|nr:molybdenum cofactor guanylyltransferase [Gammaproteobacteria bacterium]
MNGSTPHAIMMAMKTVGIILSGGQGTRVDGADKGLLPWRKTTRIESVISALRPQVDCLLISCNRNIDRYSTLGYPLVQDQLPGFQGPLAGIAAALERTECDVAVVVPCDCPEPAADLAMRLVDALESHGAQLSYAHDGNRNQYLFTAMRVACLESLHDYLATGQRSVQGWHRVLDCIAVDFSDRAADFSNFNSP